MPGETARPGSRSTSGSGSHDVRLPLNAGRLRSTVRALRLAVRHPGAVRHLPGMS